ncbi:MAG: DinB family protein [Chitinophagaceae bacterium]
MLLNHSLITELKHEAVNTRKMLENIPEAKFAWKPHEKSMTLGRLTAHIAQIPVWVNRSFEAGYFDFVTASPMPVAYETTEALLQVFDDKQAAAIAALQQATDEALAVSFAVRRGSQLVFELPRQVLIRNFVLNHIVHHRGQLSVYLRLLNLPVPGMYGPSADER